METSANPTIYRRPRLRAGSLLAAQKLMLITFSRSISLLYSLDKVDKARKYARENSSCLSDARARGARTYKSLTLYDTV
jgi:hypothetical protein